MKSKEKPVAKKAVKKTVAKKAVKKEPVAPRTKAELQSFLKDARLTTSDAGDKSPQAIRYAKENFTPEEWDNLYKGRKIGE